MTVPTFGSRIQVYRGHAKKTSGGLTKSDLMMNKHGRVVSKAKHFTAKKEMRLLKHGYGTKKGKFGYVKIGSKSQKSRSKSRSRKMRGGMHSLSPLELSENSTNGQMRGGSRMATLSNQGDANWAGDSNNGASMSGGMNRAQSRALKLAKSRSASRSLALARSLAQRGGTTSPRSQFLPSDLSSVDVQMRAGLGN